MKKFFFLIAAISSFHHALAIHILYGSEVVIGQPVYGDIYVAGGKITINARVQGDLVVAGGTVIINDTVTNDILVAAGKAVFNGFVGDDIRCAGGNIRISKNVAGDLVVTGGIVTIDKGVTIGGLLASGGDVVIDGNVDGEMKGAFGEMTLNGNVANDMDCRGGKITINGQVAGKSVLAADRITIGSDAGFNSDVRYWNRQGKLDFRQSLKSGQAMYDPSLRIRTGEWYFLGASSILGLLWYLGMALLMIVIIQYLFGNTMQKAANTVFNETLKSVGMGLAYFFGVPLLAILCLVTVIGLPVGLLLAAAYVALLLLATVITSDVTSNWINNRFSKNWGFWKLVWAAFGSFIIIKLVSLTPFVGWVAMLLMVCMAFGSILLNVQWKRKKAEVPMQG